MPIHLTNHWCLCIVDFRIHRIGYYDSLGNTNDACLDALLDYVQKEHFKHKKQSLDINSWTKVNFKVTSEQISSYDTINTVKQLEDIPRQENPYDCGVFLCQFARYYCGCLCPDRIGFSQVHLSHFIFIYTSNIKVHHALFCRPTSLTFVS